MQIGDILVGAHFTALQAKTLLENFPITNSVEIRTDTAASAVAPDFSDITFAPASTSAAILFAKVAKVTYTGPGTLTDHFGGSIGWAVHNAPGKTTPLVIGSEGKIDNVDGTITIADCLEGQIASNAAGKTITTAILNNLQVVTNAGAISTLGGTKFSVSSNVGTIGTSYAHFIGDPGPNTTNAYGTFTTNLTAATLNIGHYSAIAAGTGKFNLYMAGTAPNYIAGSVFIGAGTDSGNGSILQVTGILECLTDRGLIFNNQTSAAGASVGTLTNAPAAGNPVWWQKIKIGGASGAFPVWLG